jgi:hypothetical protein
MEQNKEQFTDWASQALWLCHDYDNFKQQVLFGTFGNWTYYKSSQISRHYSDQDDHWAIVH